MHPIKQKHTEGLLVVLSGPSGVGKGAICSMLREKSPHLQYSISATTRKPRQDEQDGVNYFFKTKEQFEQMIANDELLEWAEYVGNYYGTPLHFVQDTLRQGKDVILEIEVQGALKVKERLPQAILIFLIPPSMEELERRITQRGTETDEMIRHRLSVAKKEFAKMKHYDYVVVNDEIHAACERIQAIITAEHCRTSRFTSNQNHEK